MARAESIARCLGFAEPLPRRNPIAVEIQRTKFIPYLTREERPLGGPIRGWEFHDVHRVDVPQARHDPDL